jgi:anti-anti-sigma factor
MADVADVLEPRGDAAGDNFSITCRRVGTTVEIAVSGELDLATTPQFREACAREQRTGAEVIFIDLSKVTFMDSTGLHALVAAYGDGDERLRIILSGAAARLIDLTGQRNRLPIIHV